ncbi:glycoside hydrolase family 55 protein [Planotetraspora sp. A-T 1434]|uniref:glycoside hydrolase family 55 protein n=1 Tax=Planotetraspora sp. A-T 1434 TaxID=2979219 RepID=UPI0021C22115|nr:glycoside hydrolase family 55 protein [Planotetraspora sp. A-T 1434]MCT9932870.1 glycoside hydrolase family 55 protein [Planotetraspora sp. A-T 1434]
MAADSFDRRSFLRAAAIGAASVPFVGGFPGRAYASTDTSPLWAEFLRTPFTHPQIPNVAWAGYRGGEKHPHPPVRANVLHYGAANDGSADAAPAINRAIEDVGRRGGGTVLLPAGVYRTDDVILVGYDGVVLRGDGSAETIIQPTWHLEDVIGVHRSRFGPITRDDSAWSWTGGLVWVSHRDRYHALVDEIRATMRAPEIWTGDETLATVTTTASRGDFTVTVDDPGHLEPGMRVLLKIDDDDQYGLLKHMCGDIPGTASYVWTDKTKLVSYRPYVWPVLITGIDGNRIELEQPLPLDIRAGWRTRLTTTGPVIYEAGVAGITIRLPLVPQQKHLKDKGFNGLLFQCAWNCWADDVVVENSDNGIILTCAKNTTVRGTRVGGRMRHHSHACREQSHDNLFEDFALDEATVPLAPGANHHGINVEGLSSGNVWSNGRMDNGTFDSHRGLPFGNVRTQVVIDNDGAHGGSADAGPLYGARFAHWNVTVVNQRAGCVKIDGVAPCSATVGISEVRDFGQIDKPDFAGPLNSRLESYGDTSVVPPNLYDAQRKARRKGWR